MHVSLITRLPTSKGSCMMKFKSLNTTHMQSSCCRCCCRCASYQQGYKLYWCTRLGPREPSDPYIGCTVLQRTMQGGAL